MAEQCGHVKANGERCKGKALPSGFCRFHDPAKAAEHRRACAAGGRARSRKLATLAADAPDLPLAVPRDMLAALADTFNRVRRGELDPRVGNCLGLLAGQIMKALELTDLGERIAELERLMKEEHPAPAGWAGRWGGSTADAAPLAPPDAPPAPAPEAPLSDEVRPLDGLSDFFPPGGAQ